MSFAAPTNTRTRVDVHRLGGKLQSQDEVLRNLAQGWIPFNSVILKNIKADLESGIYRTDREQLIADIKRDPALFAYLTKQQKPSTSETSASSADLFTTLRTIDFEQIANLLPSSTKISPHQLENTTKPLAQRLQHSLMSTTAAEALARDTSLSSDLVFTTSSMRELGLNLIAWNYPRQYLKAKVSNSPRHWIELIGISPGEVSERLAIDWKLSSEIIRSLRELSTSQGSSWPESSNTAGVNLSISQLCDIGDLYARRYDPAQRQQAEKEWEKQESLWKRSLNLNVLAEVNEQVEETLSFYKKENKVFSTISLVKLQEEKNQDKLAFLQHHNPNIAKCPAHIQQLFAHVYSQIQPGAVSLPAIQLLHSQVIPTCEFSAACLYMLDVQEKKVSPVLQFGGASLAAFVPVLQDLDRHIVSLLFQEIPLKRSGLGVSSPHTMQIFSGITHPRYLGILYCELNEDLINHPTFTYFSAIRNTLRDCLG